MNPLDQLAHELSKLPGIGRKTALRLALFIIRQPEGYAQSLAQALLSSVNNIGFCKTCFHLSEGELCAICRDPKRDQELICVIEESSDLFAVEQTGGYRGVYHVLQGALSPIDGIGPENLKMRELVARVQKIHVREVILATNPNVVGDATSLYLATLLKPLGIRLSKLASGIPIGSDIEYADKVTLAKALESRVEF